MTGPLLWRNPKPKGFFRDQVHELWRDGRRLVTVSRAGNGHWHFYGLANGIHISTLRTPIDGKSTWVSLNEVKAVALSWVATAESPQE